MAEKVYTLNSDVDVQLKCQRPVLKNNVKKMILANRPVIIEDVSLKFGANVEYHP